MFVVGVSVKDRSEYKLSIESVELPTSVTKL